MQKLTALILALLILTTSVFANSEIPAALYSSVPNCTVDCEYGMSVDNCENLVKALELLPFYEDIASVLDVETFLTTLFASNTKARIQGNYNEDLTIAQFAITYDSNHNITVNNNLNLGLKSKTGIWLNVDLTDLDNLKCDIIISSPFSTKYIKYDMFALYDEADILEAFTLIRKFVTANDIINTANIRLIQNTATVKTTGVRCEISFDNDGFTAYMDGLMSLCTEIVKFFDDAEDMEYPTFKGWQILGDDGIKMTYSIKGKTISSYKLEADVSLSLNEIVTLINGYELEQDFGTLDFTYKFDAKVKDVGQTKVAFPKLTNENTTVYEPYIPIYDDDYEPDDDFAEVEYPNYYVYCEVETNRVPIYNGVIYVPLRKTLDEAYGDQYELTYSDGYITAASKHFGTIALTVNSDAAKYNNNDYTVDKVIEIDDTTYVSTSFFEQLLGWSFASVYYDAPMGLYSYDFYTSEI